MTDEPVRIMLDIEAMGTRPGAKIIAVGAARFCPVENKVWPGIEFGVDDPTGEICGHTVEWWAHPDRAEAKAYVGALGKRGPHLTALDLRAYGASFTYETHAVEWWAKGPDFDMVLLESLFERSVLPEPPWRYNMKRDVRTILAADPTFTPDEVEVGAPAHSPLADCEYQAKQVIQVMRHLRGL